MESVLIEDKGKVRKVHKSMVVDPLKLGVLGNQTALDIARALSIEPGCALDVARRLQEDEQKVYYYLKKLDDAGIVKLAGTEQRHGMTAKIYSMNASVIASKLHEDGDVISEQRPLQDHSALIFFSDFIKDGVLDAKIIIGDPDEHGRFDSKSKEGAYFSDFSMLLGSLVRNHRFPHYKIDTEVKEKDLKENLILLGNNKTNTIIDRISDSLPVGFPEGKQSFVRKENKKKYDDPRNGFVIKMKSPINPEKNVLIIGGNRTRGTRASLIAVTQDINKLISNTQDKDEYMIVVRGHDIEGTGEIDTAEFVD